MLALQKICFRKSEQISLTISPFAYIQNRKEDIEHFETLR